MLVKSVRHGDQPAAPELTRRELEILKLMAIGYRNEDIATELILSPQTVKNHVRSIYSKLEVETRVDAVLYALNHDLDDVE